MKVITLAKTKTLLGITDTDSDAVITANIPIIDATVKDISNNRFNNQVVGEITTASPYVPISSFITCGVTHRIRSSRNNFCNAGINAPFVIDDIAEYLQVGQLVEGDGIPAETYIDEVFENGLSSSVVSGLFGIPVIKLSANATATSSGQFIFLGIHIGLQPTIAKGIQYLINKTSTTLPTNSLASRSIGPSSKSFGAKDQAIDNRFGMPAWFVKAFTQYQGGH